MSVEPWTKVTKSSLVESIWMMPHKSGSRANGSLIWDYIDGKHLLAHKTGLMEFSVIDLPPEIVTMAKSGIAHDNGFGETENGDFYIVCSWGLFIRFFVQTRGPDGVDR